MLVVTTTCIIKDKQPGTRKIIERLQMKPNVLAQSAFRYILADKRVSTIACGASNAAEIEDIAQASDMGALPEELINKLKQ